MSQANNAKVEINLKTGMKLSRKGFMRLTVLQDKVHRCIKTYSFTVLSIVIILSIYAETAYGWSNGGYSGDPSNPDYGTHDWIAQHALDWLPSNEKNFIISNIATYLYGTELPDNSQAPDGIGDTTKHHVYYRADGSLQDDTSAIRAQEEFETAVSLYLSGNLSEAVKRLGAMTHYISDMAVFAHMMGASTDWGKETHHSDYENYVNQRTNSYNDEFNVFLSFDGTLDVISAYNATLRLAFDTTFDIDGDLTCVWMDRNYDWENTVFRNRCGESLNLAVNLVTDVLHTFYLRVSQVFDFSISINPSNGTVQQGGNVNTTVYIRLLSGSPLPVTLSVSGLPSGASVSLTPLSGLPPFTSNLTIITSGSTPAETYTIIVTGRYGGQAKSVEYMLAVTKLEPAEYDAPLIVILVFIALLLIIFSQVFKHKHR
jgi:hypothetical protein